jgi:hypothetical protein
LLHAGADVVGLVPNEKNTFPFLEEAIGTRERIETAREKADDVELLAGK